MTDEIMKAVVQARIKTMVYFLGDQKMLLSEDKMLFFKVQLSASEFEDFVKLVDI